MLQSQRTFWELKDFSEEQQTEEDRRAAEGGDDRWMIQGEDIRSQGGSHRGRNQRGERRDSEQED